MTTVQIIGLNLSSQVESRREGFVRAIRNAFNAGADRVELIDDTTEVGWIEADGRSHFQPGFKPLLPFDGDWPDDDG